MIRVEYGSRPGRLIQTCSARAEAGEAGCMRVVCSVSAARTMLRLGATCIRIRDAYGADVETIWNTDARRGGMTGHNRNRHTLCEEISLPPGEYTALVTFYARSGLGSDTVTCSTNPVTIE